MVASSLSIDISDVNRVLGDLQGNLSNFRPALEDIKDMQMDEIDSQYSSEGSNILGNKWTKRTKDYSWPILNKTGRMKTSHVVQSLTNTQLVITNKIPYFKYHQLGTSTMPQRQVHGHSKKMVDKALNIIADFILKKYI